VNPYQCVCGQTDPNQFYLSNRKTCKACHHVRQQEWRKVNKVHFRVLSAKYRAGKKGLHFTISNEYVEALMRYQQYECWYSKRSLIEDFSIDRIDNTKGYIIGNIVLCHIQVNYMKNDMSHIEFLGFIRDIYHTAVKQTPYDFMPTSEVPDVDEVLRQMRDYE
jgi:hypothetical protein